MNIVELPEVLSPSFIGLLCFTLTIPYVFICGIYAYHFYARKSFPKLRLENDMPIMAHINDWHVALFRPEGITAVVVYMFLNIVLSLSLPEQFGWLVPASIRDLVPTFKPFIFVVYFLVFDSSMWIIHYVQHRWRWLYYNTHSVHHTIHSPTMVVALTGYVPDTCLLILVPLHFTVLTVPYGNFITIFAFATVSLFHLHCIHSEFQHPWDPLLRKIGIVNTWDHHVHHLVPRSNLAHFFVGLDKLMNTYRSNENAKFSLHT
jgi:sterol desaturase/sphingolipid hydroxylase (fatty acid hydroxylase superfamily)